MNRIAILITCHNRKEKTKACLQALFKCTLPGNFRFDVWLVDDGSTDGTGDSVSKTFPQIRIIRGDGELYWAGGMRLAWSEARKQNYDGYLLLNDDTILYRDAFLNLLNAHNYSLEKYKREGIYVGTTNDPYTYKYTYGGKILVNRITGKSKDVKPHKEEIQKCDFANGNILLVSGSVIEIVGILSGKFTHLLADYDYTLAARKKGIPLLVCADYCGICTNDHSKNWMSAQYSLTHRLEYLKNPKHLAYKEYLYFILSNYPLYWPVSLIKLWGKTLLPIIWDKLKKVN